MASNLISEPVESSKILNFSQIEDRILRWLDNERIIMTEPGQNRNFQTQPKIQLSSKLFLSRKKKK